MLALLISLPPTFLVGNASGRLEARDGNNRLPSPLSGTKGGDGRTETFPSCVRCGTKREEEQQAETAQACDWSLRIEGRGQSSSQCSPSPHHGGSGTGEVTLRPGGRGSGSRRGGQGSWGPGRGARLLESVLPRVSIVGGTSPASIPPLGASSEVRNGVGVG